MSEIVKTLGLNNSSHILHWNTHAGVYTYFLDSTKKYIQTRSQQPANSLCMQSQTDISVLLWDSIGLLFLCLLQLPQTLKTEASPIIHLYYQSITCILSPVTTWHYHLCFMANYQLFLGTEALNISDPCRCGSNICLHKHSTYTDYKLHTDRTFWHKLSQYTNSQTHTTHKQTQMAETGRNTKQLYDIWANTIAVGGIENICFQRAESTPKTFQ
jgi:hypothetical protein